MFVPPTNESKRETAVANTLRQVPLLPSPPPPHGHGAPLLCLSVGHSYDGARAASSLAVNVTATAYFDAKDTYNGLGLRFRWPAPYDLSEEERQVERAPGTGGGPTAATKVISAFLDALIRRYLSDADKCAIFFARKVDIASFGTPF